jgi:hypothetical protein
MAANGGSRAGIVVLSLLIGAGAGYWAGARQGKADVEKAAADAAAAVKTATDKADKAAADLAAAQGKLAQLLKIQFNPLVIVGPDASVLQPSEDVRLSLSKNQQMTWRSDNGRDLSIIFPESKFLPEAKGLPPFEGMRRDKVKGKDGKDAYDWVFIHPFARNVVVSPQINHLLQPILDDPKNQNGLAYTYDQVLAGNRHDGRIIIDK